jgi:hypothetical protein
MEGLKKTTKHLSEDIWLLGLRIEPGTSWVRSRSVKYSTMMFGLAKGLREI